VKANPEPCPSCGSAQVLPIVYGEPSSEGQTRIDRGEAVVGGCMLVGDGSDPAFECQGCGGRFGVVPWNQANEKGEQDG
jgi:hypothetical protein